MDLITYVENLDAFTAEGVEIAKNPDDPRSSLFTVDEGDTGLTFNATKIPVYYTSEGKTLCVTRGVSRELIESCETIRVIGEVINNQYVFDSDEAKSIYESTYDTSTRLVDDGEGGQVEYTPPYMIGLFA